MEDIKAQVRKVNPNNSSNQSNGEDTEVEMTTYEDTDWKTIDIDFLSSYYGQDGNNSPITGGIGTEHLTDFTQKIIVSAPLNPKLKLNFDAGYDYYSSASTDNIDNIRSSDSSADMRIHFNTGLSYKLNDYKTLDFKIGGSTEYDYNSISGGFNFTTQSQDRNTAFSIGAQAFIDKWSVIFPSELRATASVPTDKRQSYNASMSLSRVLNPKMQMSLQVEGAYMNGLLSTPFHRVYFAEQDQAKIENLPGNRLKIPIGLRFNYHISEWLVMRSHYRYYWDDWGMQAHTVGIELPIKINRFFSIAPHYRYHTQTAIDYFKPYKEHNLSEEFYSSDYDLSALNSHSFGLGINYSPVNGLAKFHIPFSKKVVMMKSIDLKYSHYMRSTGLDANIISLGVSFSLY